MSVYEHHKGIIWTTYDSQSSTGDETGECPRGHSPWKLGQEGADPLNGSASVREMELCVKNLPLKNKHI